MLYNHLQSFDLILSYFKIFYFNLVPFALLTAFLAIFQYDLLLILITILTPLSVNLSQLIEGLPFDFSIFTEPFMAILLFVLICKFFLGKKLDRKILIHPVSIAIYINLFWIFITSVTSTMPIVSFKFFLVRTWFVVCFYFLAAEIFKNYNRAYKFFWYYAIPLTITIFYVFYNLHTNGTTDKIVVQNSMVPLFKDHTVYGAVVAMFVPGLIIFSFLKDSPFKRFRLLLIGLTIVFIIALIYSYSRAAWISVVIAFIAIMIIKLKIKFRTLLILFTLFVFYFATYYNEIIMQLEKNKQDSSEELSKHVQSITNIRTDASNLERINRWSCAIRMFKEKPVFGWGPGTYMFQYAPYQMSYNRTTSSSNFGEIGNAHSEYIGPLAEEGVLGSLTFIVIIVVTILTALKIYQKTNDRFTKNLVLAMLSGLITYYTHGILNNFLDQDKASVPFWGFMAVIVAIDIYHLEHKNTEAY